MDSTRTDTSLIARGVCRSFTTAEGTLEVLKGVNLTVSQGEMVAIVGESGVGKSTLLHILGGLDRPTQGDISYRGKPLHTMSENELSHFRNRHIGFVFQHHYLMDDFTALENVMIPALVAGKTKKEAAALAEQLLHDVGLKERMNHVPRQLSGGEQQRVAVARALANSPDVVMADEPSGNLDIRTGEKLHGLLRDLNQKRNMTMIIATHNLELATSCDKTVKLIDGLASEELNGKVVS
ncbi:MAG: ABC transporter ATP-binding protein [candidate division Zixibacteria bacterium]|nr:ABC transporter ATP-binding protein [candidate division Zixibacteria bacterium]